MTPLVNFISVPPLFEIHHARKFYKGLRVERELSGLSLQRGEKVIQTEVLSEPLIIVQNRNVLSMSRKCSLNISFNIGKAETFQCFLHFISSLYHCPRYHNTKNHLLYHSPYPLIGFGSYMQKREDLVQHVCRLRHYYMQTELLLGGNKKLESTATGPITCLRWPHQ